jgi:hypothetical protein
MATQKENILDVNRLQELIREKKLQQDMEWIAIKEEFSELKTSLNPLNIIRRTFNELNENVGLKSDLAQSAISIGLGYMAKKLVVGKTNSIFKNIFGSLLQLVVTTMVSKPKGDNTAHSAAQYSDDATQVS